MFELMNYLKNNNFIGICFLTYRRELVLAIKTNRNYAPFDFWLSKSTFYKYLMNNSSTIYKIINYV